MGEWVKYTAVGPGWGAEVELGGSSGGKKRKNT